MTGLSRRDFVQSAGAAALVVAIGTPGGGRAAAKAAAAGFGPYLRIGSDGRVTAVLPTSEMGQGTHTGQLMILGEELGVAPAAIDVEMPLRPTDAYRLFFGQMRSVGSYGIRAWYEPLRKAAAQARAVLVQAAARRLGVDAAGLDTVDGHVVHAASARRLPFGELAAAAAGLPVPEDPPLRPAGERRIVGRAMPRVDTPAKVDGTAVFGTDVHIDDMLHGAIHMSPVFGAQVAGYDRDAAMRMPGVVDVVAVPHGVVVVADTWWRAKRAADALAIRFEATDNDTLSSSALSAAMREGLDGQLPPVTRAGDSAAGFAAAAQTVEAIYEVPFLTHVCMEPLVCTAHTREDHVELWMPTQGHDIVRMTVARVLGFGNEQMTLHTTYLGGGFGRKTHGEIAEQAMLASRAVMTGR
ncbi:MAG: molybdopterin cofactor-binding domain-containing protein [Pseudomonadota bacterium]